MRRWFLLPLLVPGVVACEAVLGVDFGNAVSANERDGGSGAQGGAGGSCQSVQPESEPGVSGVGGDIEVIVVARDPRYGDDLLGPDDYQFDDIGFDLDDNCTNIGDAPLCAPPQWTGGVPSYGPGGRDNAIGAMLVSQIEKFGPVITSDIVSESTDAGTYAPPVVLRIRGYSGFAEDDEVEVEWFVPRPASEASGGGFTPAYDGSDPWPVDEDYVTIETNADAGADASAGAPVSVFRSTRAYVNRSHLVAYFDTSLLPLANVYFDVENAVVTGLLRLVPGTQRFELADGTLAGSSPADKILAVVPRITRAVQSVEVCTDSEIYTQIKKFVCEQADLLLPGSSGTECNSMSFAIAFQGRPAEIGTPVRRPQEQPFCQQADPADDSCANADIP